MKSQNQYSYRKTAKNEHLSSLAVVVYRRIASDPYFFWNLAAMSNDSCMKALLGKYTVSFLLSNDSVEFFQV